MVDEEDTVEVVDFVKKGAGEVAAGFNADFGAIFENGFNLGFGRATNEAINIWHGKAAFLVDLDFAFGADDFRIDKGGEGAVFFVVEVVADDDDALILAELGGGHGGGEFVRVLIFPLKRRGNHIGDKAACVVGNLADFGGFLTKTGIWCGNNFSHCIYYNTRWRRCTCGGGNFGVLKVKL